MRILLLLPLLLWSCDNAYVNVLRGNYQYNAGNFSRALTHYLEAEKNPEFSSWLAYNLGNLYHATGEQPSALKIWEGISPGVNEDLLFATSFNRGLLYYEQGLFTEAYEQFKYALSLKSNSIPAKVNLELSLEKMNVHNRALPESQERNSKPSPESVRALDYIRRKEVQAWQTPQDIDLTSVVRDW